MLRRTLVSLWLAGACLAIGVAPATSYAGEEQAELTMVRLLRADAIVFATVTRLSRLSDEGNLVNVQLGDVLTIKSRWSEAISLLRVRGALRQPDAQTRSVKVGYAGTLREGKRYMLMLSGGRWQVAPLLSGGESMFEVGTDGVLRCGSGEVYGIDDRGFVCSHADDQAGPPLTEYSASELLIRRLERARRQRSKLEADFARASRPLRLEPDVE